MSHILNYFGIGLPGLAHQAASSPPQPPGPSLQQKAGIIRQYGFTPEGMTPAQVEMFYRLVLNSGRTPVQEATRPTTTQPFETRKVGKTPANQNRPFGDPGEARNPFVTSQYEPTETGWNPKMPEGWPGHPDFDPGPVINPNDITAAKASREGTKAVDDALRNYDPLQDRELALQNWRQMIVDDIARMSGALPAPANDLPLAPFSAIDMPPSNWPGVTNDAVSGARPMQPNEADIRAAMARMKAGILSPESQAYAERNNLPLPTPTLGNQPGLPMTPPQAVGRPPSSLVGEEEKLQRQREGDPSNDNRPTE